MSSVRVVGLLTVLLTGSPAVAQPMSDPTARVRIDKDLEMFRRIRDDTPFPWTVTGEKTADRIDDDRMEELAYDEVLRHARQFSTAELEQAARRDVNRADLVVPARLSYKLELVYLEGRLRRLRRADPTTTLKESGVSDVYEAWLFPRDEWNPVCVFVTELSPGLAPQKSTTEEVDKWVAVAGYSFKLLRYESERKDPRTPDRNKVLQAPVLIGRGLRELPAPTDADPGRAWQTAFLPLILGLTAGLAAVLVGLGWWFRRGDRNVRQQIEQTRTKNPFSEGAS